MKKVVCPRCGLVNLDGFVSFPHCAACGALLPQHEPARWRQTLRRPVSPFYWMLAVGSGLALLGLAIASIARETRAVSDKPLLVYAQIPRAVAPGEVVTAQFTLDSAQENPDERFAGVSLRLNPETQRAFVVVRVQPAPAAVETRGRGYYYLWNELPRNVALQLALRPRSRTRRAGEVLPLHVTVWAAQHRPFEVRASIPTASLAATAPAPMQSAPEMAR